MALQKRSAPPPARAAKPLAERQPAPRKLAAPPPPAVEQATAEYKPSYQTRVAEKLNVRTDPGMNMRGVYDAYDPVVLDVLDAVGLNNLSRKLGAALSQVIKPTVTVQDPNDVEGLRHELAHAMDDYHNITTSRYGTPGTTAIPTNAGPRMGALRENPFLFQILMRRPTVAQSFPGMLGTPPMNVPGWGPWGDRHELYAYMAQQLPLEDPTQSLAWARPYFPFYRPEVIR